MLCESCTMEGCNSQAFAFFLQAWVADLVRPGRLGQEEAHKGEGQTSAPPDNVIPVLPRRAQVLQQLMQPPPRQLVQLCAWLPQQPALSKDM